MHRYEQRRDPTRLMWRRLMAVILLIILAIAIRGVWGVYEKEQESRKLRTEAEARLNDLKEREAKMHADISLLRTDRGVESQLRERYDLAKNNEGVIVIVEPPAAPIEERQTTFEKFKGWFEW